MRPPTLPMPAVRDDVMALEGGVDQLTPSSGLKPGVLREGINWECDRSGGYRYPEGFERVDGRPSPSAATFYLVALTGFQAMPSVGQTLTGATSGATGTILWLENTATRKYIAVYVTSTTPFTQSEQVTVGTTVIGTATTPTTQPTRQVQAIIQAAAADIRRPLIAAPPGSGPVRGVVGAIFNHKFELFAFRDATDGLSGNIWKATSAGWVQVPLMMQLPFEQAGPVAFQEGMIVDSADGEVPATIRRVVLQSGTYDANTAAGWLILDTTDAPGDWVWLLSPFTFGQTTFSVPIGHFSTAITIKPGGRYEFDVANFGGQLSSTRIYGCDGANYGFEFDGDVYVPIRTGTSPDTPSHVKVHHRHLLFAVGSSLINSGTGTPYNWTATAGAAELATGDQITGFEQLPGNQDNAALAVYNRNHTHVLYGTSAANWKLVPFENDMGAVPFSVLKMEQTYVLDERGVIGFRQGQDFGNFNSSAHTQSIQPWIDSRRGRFLCATVHRSKSQLRFYFNDGFALYVTIVRGKLVGNAPMYFPVRFACIWSGENESGQEVLYAGGTDGMVYELDRGTSFDGAAIFTWLMTNWNPLGNPNLEKSMLFANLEITRGSYAECQIKPEYSYQSPYGAQPAFESHMNDEPILPQWDQATMQWDHFTWDGEAVERRLIELRGDETAIRYLIRSELTYVPAFTLSSIVTSYIPRPARRYA